jgi:hypothetical protein
MPNTWSNGVVEGWSAAETGFMGILNILSNTPKLHDSTTP